MLFLHCISISTGNLHIFIPRRRIRWFLTHLGLIVELHPFTQKGIALSAVFLVDRHKQRFLLADQQYTALGSRNCGIEYIPGKKNPVGGQNGDDDRVVLGALRLMDRHCVGKVQLMQILQGKFGIPAIKIDCRDAGLDLADDTHITVENTFADGLAPSILQFNVIVVPGLDDAVIQLE